MTCATCNGANIALQFETFCSSHLFIDSLIRFVLLDHRNMSVLCQSSTRGSQSLCHMNTGSTLLLFASGNSKRGTKAN